MPRLRLGEELDRRGLGDEHGAGEVVRLDPLPEELAVVGRLGQPEHVRRDRLQHRRARVGAAAAERQVDAHVLGVGDRAGRVRQIGHRVEREPELRGELGDAALRERAAGVVDEREQLAGAGLELGVVVAGARLLGPQLAVDAARLLGRRGALLVQPQQLGVQREDRRDRVVAERLPHRQLGQLQAAVERAALRLLERDLERIPLRGRLGAQQLGGRHPEDAGDALELAELQLALAVLDHRHLRGRALEARREVVQRPAAGESLRADALADDQGVEHASIVLARHSVVHHRRSMTQRDSSRKQKSSRISAPETPPPGLRRAQRGGHHPLDDERTTTPTKES